MPTNAHHDPWRVSWWTTTRGTSTPPSRRQRCSLTVGEGPAAQHLAVRPRRPGPDMSLFRFVQWVREGRPVRVFGDGRWDDG